MSDDQSYPQYPDYGKDETPRAAPDGSPGPPPPYGQQPPPYGQQAPTYGQQPPPYGYGQAYPPGHGYGYGPPVPSTNQTSVWAMVLGILSILFCYVGLIIGPVAIGLAIAARRQVADSRGAQTGGGMAVAGLVTGIVGTVIWAGFIALIIGVTVA